jgi:hypothetical protein
MIKLIITVLLTSSLLFGNNNIDTVSPSERQLELEIELERIKLKRAQLEPQYIENKSQNIYFEIGTDVIGGAWDTLDLYVDDKIVQSTTSHSIYDYSKYFFKIGFGEFHENRHEFFYNETSSESNNLITSNKAVSFGYDYYLTANFSQQSIFFNIGFQLGKRSLTDTEKLSINGDTFKYSGLQASIGTLLQFSKNIESKVALSHTKYYWDELSSNNTNIITSTRFNSIYFGLAFRF